MRKIFLLTTSLLLACFVTKAQVVSLFDFEDPTNNERIAAVGPNATSSGSNAICAASGTSGDGCNAGVGCGICNSFCYSNINLVVPNTGSVLNVPEMQMSIDYRLSPGCGGAVEVDAWFFQRGQFAFGMSGGKLSYAFAVDNFGIRTQIPASGVRQCWGCDLQLTDGIIPPDGVWRNYRFEYLQADGIMRLYINGILEYAITNPAEQFPGRPLDWSTNPAAMAIGSNMDGMGNNIPIIDNAMIQIPPPLPVTLSAFDAKAEGLRTKVSWETASELNNDFFTVERSTDEGETFQPIGKIEGSGTTTEPREYEFWDENPQKGSNYYRLRQTDMNGQSHAYYTVEVLYSFGTSGLIALYPNPVGGNQMLNLRFNADHDMNGDITVFDMGGKVVLKDALFLSEGMHNIILPVEELNHGMYIVKMVAGGKVYTDKFLKAASN